MSQGDTAPRSHRLLEPKPSLSRGGALLVIAAVLVPMVTATEVRAADPEILLGRKRVGEYQGVRGTDFLAWQQNTSGQPRQYDVFARPLDGGESFQVNPEGTKGANGDIDGDTLVFQQFDGPSSDLKFFDLVDRTTSDPPSGVNTPRWEYWPSMSGRWLLFGRLFPSGARRVILFDLTTGESETLDKVRSEEAFIGPGQVNGNWAVWYTCTPDFECDVIRYRISDGQAETIPNPGPRQRVPSVTPDGTVFLARSKRGCGNDVRLLRYTREGQRTVLWRLPDGHDVGSTRAFVDGGGDITFYFDNFTCGRPAVSNVWEWVERTPRRLEVEVDGQGTVTSSPAGIDCGPDCSETYDPGTSVTLTAKPGGVSTFAGWSGACIGSSTTCTVTMDASRSVTATFTTKPVLEVIPAGTGTGTVTSTPAGIDCGDDCNEPYDQGTSVTLTAAADSGSTFTGWSGACTGTGGCTVTMNSSMSVTATFTATAVNHQLTVTLGGNGSGTVTSDTGGIACPGTCSAEYTPDTDVELTASPGTGSEFAGFTGCNSTPTTNTCVVTMDGAKSVTATFNLEPPGLLKLDP